MHLLYSNYFFCAKYPVGDFGLGQYISKADLSLIKQLLIDLQSGL